MAQFYLASKGKCILEKWGQADPKDTKRRDPRLNFGPSFYIFSLFPLSLPYVNWASQEACCFTWGSHSGPWTFLCSIFVGFSLFWLLAILDSFSYSNCLTGSWNQFLKISSSLKTSSTRCPGAQSASLHLNPSGSGGAEGQLQHRVQSPQRQVASAHVAAVQLLAMLLAHASL